MTAVWIAAYALLSAGALLCLLRLALGSSLLDRVVATETLLAIVTAGFAAHVALARDPTFVPVLVVVALLGFIGAVSISRYVGGMLMRSSDDGRDRGPAPADGPAPGGERDADRG